MHEDDNQGPLSDPNSAYMAEFYGRSVTLGLPLEIEKKGRPAGVISEFLRGGNDGIGP